MSVQAQSQLEVYKHSRCVGHLTAGPGCEVDRLGLVVRINDAPAPGLCFILVSCGALPALAREIKAPTCQWHRSEISTMVADDHLFGS